MNKERLRRIPINAVVLSIILLNTFILLVLTSTILLSRYSLGNQQVAMQNTEQTTENIAKSIEAFIEEKIEDLNWVKENARQEDLETITTINQDIIMIGIFDSSGQVMNYASQSDEPLKELTGDENLSFRFVTDAEKGIYISPPHVNNMFETYYPWVVSFVSEMKIGDEQYYIVMDIDLGKISQYIDKIYIGNRGYVFIADDAGEIIYHPQQGLIYSDLKEENLSILPKVYEEGALIVDPNIYAACLILNTNWRVVGVSNMDEMVTQMTEEFSSYAMIVLASAFLVSLLLVTVLFRFLTRPVNRLIKSIQSFEVNMESYVYQEAYGVKEVVELRTSFDHMAEKIKLLVGQIVHNEKELQKFELKALQAQINPHFLYNTLDSIFWMCQEEGNNDAANMVAALSDTFRISISRGKDEIIISDEIKHVKSYLIILTMRYKNQFSYTFEVEEEVMQYKCLKILLQPFVENAIYHGLNRMVDEGEILIRGYLEGEDIVFQIRDNGIGMDEEEVDRLLVENNDKVGIGVKNVHDRIRIYYGESYGVSIKSDLDMGTTITLRIPKIQEEEKGENKDKKSN